MDKIYRLRREANSMLSARGHVVGKYFRAFEVNESGELVTILYRNCHVCGKRIQICDKPKPGNSYIYGEASETNCTAPTITVPAPRNIWAGNVRKENKDKNKAKLAKVLKKFAIK